jgi:formylglycine-generating enzyme required for sulfatase activity
MVDVALSPADVAGGELRLDVSLETRKLARFAGNGAAVYERSTERRALRVLPGGNSVVPVLIASQREEDEFRVQELLLRFRARSLGEGPRAEYGEIAVAADVPRAEILLDGGAVGRTASTGSVVIGPVLTGVRELVVRDPSGRETRVMAGVEKGRRTEVQVTLLPPPSSAGPRGMRPIGRNAQGVEEFWRQKDGAIVVRIPGGRFLMGSGEREGEPAERPQHAVRVRGFLMDKTEVSWGQYRRFVGDTGRSIPTAPVWGTPDELPASNVTWDDARVFCAWAGGRLPTEAEWERAARGDDTRIHPWGSDWEPTRCNTQDGGPHGPTPVAAYPDCVSPYGVLDLSGSVWEWCADWYADDYYWSSPEENPPGPERGRVRVSRGASWINSRFWNRTAFRQGIDPSWPDPLRGFRCVQDDSGREAANRPVPEPTEPAPPRVQIEVVTSADGRGGAVDRCEVVQRTRRDVLTFWATFGEGAPGPAGRVQSQPGPGRCGSGSFLGVSAPPSASGIGAAPLLTIETSATPTYDPGAMDPGPVPVVQVVLVVKSRRLTGFSAGKPVYAEPVTDQRAVRLGQGDEYAAPLPIVDPGLAETLGTGAVLLRVRAVHTGRPGPTEYGALTVVAAAAGSEVLVDGGVAGRVGEDGTLLLRAIRAGDHQVHMRNDSGHQTARVVSVVRGRTVIVSAAAAAGAADEAGSSELVPIGNNVKGFPEFRRRCDGAVMVRVPEGEFVMGNLETEGKPLPHLVSVSSFLIDKLPVTWRRFKLFAAATGWPLPPIPYWGIHDDHPVVFVRWDEGRAYCEWAGGRLPTEAEREKAARGTDGRLFPWGNEPPSPERGVFRRNWGREGTDAVGIRPAGMSPWGLLDAGGNVWEWCEDWYDPDYYQSSPREDPTGPRTGRARVVRGGSWDSRPTVLSASCRNFGYVGYREADFGFRCAADLPR